MRVVIVGCGRVGSSVAREMVGLGHEVAVIDLQPSAFDRLGPDFKGTLVVGTGIDQDVLERAGTGHADCFLSVTNGDNRNIMAAQIAREIFKVPKVVTRIYDPIRERVYRELGLYTYCPTLIGAGIARTYFLEGAAAADAASELVTGGTPIGAASGG
ncbi:MAG TPA: TrkA family potassium uptake protein [Candidatus Dormibacteraeota bacterium]|nr:TrkA family potassium uptake protein [Candidatus Dormibacteraeota bacterium]